MLGSLVHAGDVKSKKRNGLSTRPFLSSESVPLLFLFDKWDLG